MKNQYSLLKLWQLQLFIFLLLGMIRTYSQQVIPYITKADQSKLLEPQPTLSFVANSGTNNSTITFNPNSVNQTVDGFGWTLTEGSAEMISLLKPEFQNHLLNDIYNPTTGISSNVVRISIGASDLGSSVYTYCDTSNDNSLSTFSLNGPDKNYVIPILKKILQINPNIKILATPWTAPKWMKTNGSYIGGKLKESHYSIYASYFVKYLQAMQAEGFSIWGITPQNEPENPNNEPSMLMTSGEQTSFINNHLGPQLQQNNFGAVKIIAFDHNCDNLNYPVDVLLNSSYTDGAAFHLYLGDISAMSYVHFATGKNVYFTEQYTDGNSTFAYDFNWHTEKTIVGAMNNWAKTSIQWNLANNAALGPRTAGGCSDCLGAITVNDSNSYTKNVSYYIIAQLSKFVKQNAANVSATSTDNNLIATGFVNPDNSKVLLLYNTGNSTRNSKIVEGNQAFNYSIPAYTSVTFVWSNNELIPVNSISLSPATANLGVGNGLQLNAELSPTNATNKNIIWTSSNSAAASVDQNGFVSGLAVGSAIVTAKTVDGNKTATSSINVIIPANQFSDYYNIISKNSGKGLDVANNSNQSGASIQQWEISGNGTNNQQWTLVDAGNGQYYIKVRSSNLYLTPVSTTVVNGTKVVQKTLDNTNAFKWNVTNLGNGYYKIENVLSGKALDVENVSAENGALIHLWDYLGADNQQWQFRQAALGVNDISTKAIQIYPNPVKDILNIQSEKSSEAFIYDFSGKLLMKKSLNTGKNNINVKSLTKGNYVLKIIDQNSKPEVFKLIKE